MAPLRFVGYEASAREPNVVVDGSPNAGTVLVLSHWPGMPTPPGVEADSSCQMVFRYLDRGADLHGDARAVTNNHFDQDGLAGVYALTDPDDGMRRRAQLEGLASAGDFGVAPDRTSARISMAVSALSDPATSPLSLPAGYDEMCVVLYEHALAVLPAWLDDPDRCRELWAGEDAELDAGERALASGEVRIEERPEVDLAVVTLPASGRSGGHRFAGRRFDGIHPMALHAATDRSVLLVLDPAASRHRLTCRYEGWVQFRSRPIRPRVDLVPLAARLTAEETGGARWTATSPAELTPELTTDAAGPASSIDPQRLVFEVVRFLAEAPTAWDPYAPTSR
ncbi:MAG TPA: DUF6687 family protein [Acidimicrobiales bacterium]|nr:DUF6687 family protein [Acidimicrobiales bacterium]